MLKKSKPLFISLEGGEGCGKTTQLKLLGEWLTEKGVNFIQTREPGGSPIGKEIRKILLEGDKDKITTLTESLLFAADRNEHMRQVIMPALMLKNQWVITDRFADSTTVYQSYVQGLPTEYIETLHDMVIPKWPDLTLILDIPVEIGLARKGKQAQEGLTETRFEDVGQSFHEKVRQGFLEIAKAEPERCKIIDATGSVDKIQTSLQNAILAHCK